MNYPTTPTKEDSSISKLAVEYVKKFGKNRDLQQYLIVSTPLSISNENINSDEVLVAREIQLASILKKNDQPKCFTSRATNPPEIFVGDMETGRLSSASSIVSDKRLEWDSGADVGYINYYNSKHNKEKSTSMPSLTTIDSSGHSKQNFLSSDTQINEKKEQSYFESTPKNTTPKKMFQVSDSQITPIQNEDGKSTKSVNKIRFKIKNSKFRKLKRKKSISLEDNRTKEPVTMSKKSFSQPNVNLDKEKSSIVENMFIFSPNYVSSLKKQKESEKLNKEIQTTLEKSETKNSTEAISEAETKIDKKLLKKQSDENLGEILLPKSSSFEYLSGQTYELLNMGTKIQTDDIDILPHYTEQNVFQNNLRKSKALDNLNKYQSDTLTSATDSTHIPTSGHQSDNSIGGILVGSQYSTNLSKDLEQTIDALKHIIETKKCDSIDKKRLVQKIVKKIINTQYDEDSSPQNVGNDICENTLKKNVPWIPATITKNSKLRQYSNNSSAISETKQKSIDHSLAGYDYIQEKKQFLSEPNLIENEASVGPVINKKDSTSTSDTRKSQERIAISSTDSGSSTLNWKKNITFSEQIFHERAKYLQKQRLVHDNLQRKIKSRKKRNPFTHSAAIQKDIVNSAAQKGDTLDPKKHKVLLEITEKERENQLKLIKSEIYYLNKLKLLLEAKNNMPQLSPTQIYALYSVKRRKNVQMKDISTTTTDKSVTLSEQTLEGDKTSSSLSSRVTSLNQPSVTAIKSSSGTTSSSTGSDRSTSSKQPPVTNEKSRNSSHVNLSNKDDELQKFDSGSSLNRSDKINRNSSIELIRSVSAYLNDAPDYKTKTETNESAEKCISNIKDKSQVYYVTGPVFNTSCKNVANNGYVDSQKRVSYSGNKSDGRQSTTSSATDSNRSRNSNTKSSMNSIQIRKIIEKLLPPLIEKLSSKPCQTIIDSDKNSVNASEMRHIIEELLTYKFDRLSCEVSKIITENINCSTDLNQMRHIVDDIKSKIERLSSEVSESIIKNNKTSMDSNQICQTVDGILQSKTEGLSNKLSQIIINNNRNSMDSNQMLKISKLIERLLMAKHERSSSNVEKIMCEIKHDARNIQGNNISPLVLNQETELSSKSPQSKQMQFIRCHEKKELFSDERRKEFSDERKKEFSGQRRKEFSDERKKEFSDERKKEFSDERKKEFCDERKKEFSCQRRKEFSDERKKEFCDERKKEFCDERREEFSDETSKQKECQDSKTLHFNVRDGIRCFCERRTKNYSDACCQTSLNSEIIINCHSKRCNCSTRQRRESGCPFCNAKKLSSRLKNDVCCKCKKPKRNASKSHKTLSKVLESQECNNKESSQSISGNQVLKESEISNAISSGVSEAIQEHHINCIRRERSCNSKDHQDFETYINVSKIMTPSTNNSKKIENVPPCKCYDSHHICPRAQEFIYDSIEVPEYDYTIGLEASSCGEADDLEYYNCHTSHCPHCPMSYVLDPNYSEVRNLSSKSSSSTLSHEYDSVSRSVTENINTEKMANVQPSDQNSIKLHPENREHQEYDSSSSRSIKSIIKPEVLSPNRCRAGSSKQCNCCVSQRKVHSELQMRQKVQDMINRCEVCNKQNNKNEKTRPCCQGTNWQFVDPTKVNDKPTQQNVCCCNQYATLCKNCQKRYHSEIIRQQSVSYYLRVESREDLIIEEDTPPVHSRMSVEEVKIFLPKFIKSGERLVPNSDGKFIECTEKHQVPPLKEFLLKNYPQFVQSADNRRQYIIESAAERNIRKKWTNCMLNEIGSSNFGESDFSSMLNEMPFRKSKKKRIFSTKTMKQMTRKNYKKLPEVNQRKLETKHRHQARTNRLMMQLFSKKLQKKVHQGQLDISLSKNII